MLETLDAVPWDTLKHAYGKASNVPDFIRSLASNDKQVCEDTLDWLWFTVIHQGTIYNATAYVVPFFKDAMLFFRGSHFKTTSEIQALDKISSIRDSHFLPVQFSSGNTSWKPDTARSCSMELATTFMGTERPLAK